MRAGNERNLHMKTTTTSAALKLLWSERGEISCLEHAPFRGTDTWVWDRWKPIKPHEAVEFERDNGRAPTCETCAAVERNAKERQ